MTTPPNSAPEPYSQPGQSAQPSNPYTASTPGGYAPQPQPGEPGGPTIGPGGSGVPISNPEPQPVQHDTVKPAMGILLGFVGAAIFGFTFLTWASISGLEEWAAFFTNLGEPTTVNSLASDMGLNDTSANGRVSEFTGLWVGFIGLGIAVVGGSLRQGNLAAFGGLIGAAGSAVAGVLTFMSYNTISGWNDDIRADMAGFDSAALGLPMPAFEVGIGLWLTLAASALGIVVGVLAYTTRNRINPPSAPGITASDSGTSPAPGLY